ncbi:hypothetical protein Tco_1566208, partial [Tanacetum coccineum]
GRSLHTEQLEVETDGCIALELSMRNHDTDMVVVKLADIADIVDVADVVDVVVADVVVDAIHHLQK